MTQHIEAIFDGGVLRPLEPLDLPDKQVVSIAIEKLDEERSAVTDATEPTLYEILDAAGLVGCIDGLPADLSTNPEHMEGFGKSG